VKTTRAAVFIVTGLLFAASSLTFLFGGNFQNARSLMDWFTVFSLSAALLALAVAAPMLARVAGTRWTIHASLLASAGATLAAIANLLEDALHMDWAFAVFVVGSAVTQVGLAATAITIAAGARGSDRALALVPAIVILDLLILHPVGGGVLVLAAWIWAAAVVLSWPRSFRARMNRAP
jgi:hypothetical protein